MRHARADSTSGHRSTTAGGALFALAVSALGVVYGDIGTSPLYALRECFSGLHAIAPTPANIFGVLSLIFWSLIIVITLKYIVFILRADNRVRLSLTVIGVPILNKSTDPWTILCDQTAGGAHGSAARMVPQ
ncbi:MAG: KUP/HAK/KT family potassium transporter, partial [Chloroflexota bacterium]|nr:KUP/HAK/KT family potassium transporter [Chloroflexota bacterium]